MSEHFKQIYAQRAAEYDAMVSREDYQGNLLPALESFAPLAGAQVVEFGAGSGRLTRLIAPLAASVVACDNAPAMLAQARPTLPASVAYAVADNRAMPIDSGVADISLAGWSFGHATGWNPTGWAHDIAAMVSEMLRVTRSGGTAIILETLGTGTADPQPPNSALAAYYIWLETVVGFSRRVIRTDYRFESVEEADRLTRFFFGDGLADKIRQDGLTVLPEYTGVWGLTVP
jgi:ubiquinone/menaquinone biosynthesis C-methylase UbiE